MGGADRRSSALVSLRRSTPPRQGTHPLGRAAGGLCSFISVWLMAQMSLEWLCLAKGSPSARVRKAGRCSGSSRQHPGSRLSGVLRADRPACGAGVAEANVQGAVPWTGCPQLNAQEAACSRRADAWKREHKLAM